MKIGVTTTVKAPRDMLLHFIEHHRALGVDHMVIFLDDPDQLEQWREYPDGAVEFVSCDKRYWSSTLGARPDIVVRRQQHNVNQAKQILEAHGCDWLIHVDVDELIRPIQPHNLRSALENCDKDCLRFALREAVAPRAKDSGYFGASWFKKRLSRKKMNYLRWLGCGKVLLDGDYFRGHTASKCAARLSDRIQTYGVHLPVPADGELEVQHSKQIQLLHFDAVCYSAWVEKMKLRQAEMNLEVNPTIRDERKNQFHRFAEALDEGEKSVFRLYLDAYTLTFRQKMTLWLLGALIYIPASGRQFHQRRADPS